MKRIILNNVKEIISQRFNKSLDCFKNGEEEKNKRKIYFKNHYVKLSRTLIEKYQIETEKDFEKISKENLLDLIKTKTKEEKKGKELNCTEADRLIMYINFLNDIFSWNSEKIHISFEETELFSSTKTIKCPYCGSTAKFIPSSEIKNFAVYICPTCHSKASVHKNTNIPTGTMANENLRTLRKRVYSVSQQMFPKEHWKVYPFIENVCGRKFDHSVGYISNLTENECKKILKLFNFLYGYLKKLEKTKSTRKNHYLLMHYFISKASVLELRAFYLLYNNFNFLQSCEKLKLNNEEYYVLLIKMFYNGCNINFKNLPIVKKFVTEYNNILINYYNEDFSKFVKTMMESNVQGFNNIGNRAFYLSLAYFSRIILLKRLKDMPEVEFDKIKFIK